LRAAALDEQDLAAALESGAQLWTAGSGMEVDVDVEGDSATLPENLAHQVLRIAQEAVTNVVKHAGANHVSLRLSVDPGGLQLNIVDDGRGFDASTAFASGNEHFGLIGMRERAKRMGGNVSLVTRPGEGTELNLKVPVK
jgi:signal transduction histidine kinase